MKKSLIATGICLCMAALASLLQLPTCAQFIRPLSAMVISGLNLLTSLVPFSLTIWIFPVVIGGIVWLIVHNVRRKRFFGWVLPLVNGLLGVYILFMVLFGYAYHLPSITTILPYKASSQPTAVLARVTQDMIDDLNYYSRVVSRDSAGQVQFKSFNHHSQVINDSYRHLLRKYGTRHLNLGRAKKAGYLSTPMSYVNIAGFYFPFTAEANVSTDMVATHIPYNIAHEQAHVLGVAPEDEAGFVAFLACIESGDMEVIYSALLNGYVYAINAVYYADPQLAGGLGSLISQEARGDLARLSTHLERYETPLKDMGDAVNGAYLKSNGQVEGVETYGFMVDLLISYYLS